MVDPIHYLHHGLGGLPVDEDGLTPPYYDPYEGTILHGWGTDYGSLPGEVLSGKELVLVALGVIAALLTPVIIWRKWRGRRSS